MKLKNYLFISCCVLFFTIKISAQYSASNFTLVSVTDPETTFNPDNQKYSGCWGWFHPTKNKEFAIACSHRGTYWIDVTVAATPSVSAYKAGKLSGCTWREAKSYRNYLYVISDDAGSNSLQIFDMHYLPDSVHKVYDGQTLFSRGHTLHITNDKLYIGSATLGNSFSSMQVYSLANPELPVLLRKLEQDYPTINHVHDMLVRNDTVYASCGYQGLFVYKFTAANTFSLLGSLTSYPSSGYNHSSAITPDGRTLVFMDEVPSGLPIKVADVTNLSNIQVLATINQFPQTTPHNPFMGNNTYCFASSYQDGLQLFDISTPASPVLAGYFDTHPQSGGNNNVWSSSSTYDGQWGSYPYLPSGNIFALDRTNGAFLLRTTLFTEPLVTADFYLPAKICLGNSLEIYNNSQGANTFTWTFQNGTVATSTLGNASISFPTTGTYTVSLLAANAATYASVTKTITVINSGISATTTYTQASCSTCTTGMAAVTATGGTSPYTYTWMPGGSHVAKPKNLLPGCYTVTIQDAYKCKTTESVCIDYYTEVGIPMLSGDAGPAIYPNPASNQITLRYLSGGSTVVQIKSILGELIFEKKFSGPVDEVLDTKAFLDGTYIISVTENDVIKSRKLIIHH
ncbi:hypothetical protein CNR22_17575 [Sphingobacteriaceae bacterium]|nr:hypothetical protein CNR22_17575 [Sphingobacteriaceae bacterium]